MTVRNASHAGSWYTGNGTSLSKELDAWLGQVAQNINGVGQIPQSGARVIIAPYDRVLFVGNFNC